MRKTKENIIKIVLFCTLFAIAFSFGLIVDNNVYGTETPATVSTTTYIENHEVEEGITLNINESTLESESDAIEKGFEKKEKNQKRLRIVMIIVFIIVIAIAFTYLRKPVNYSELLNKRYEKVKREKRNMHNPRR